MRRVRCNSQSSDNSHEFIFYYNLCICFSLTISGDTSVENYSRVLERITLILFDTDFYRKYMRRKF